MTGNFTQLPAKPSSCPGIETRFELFNPDAKLHGLRILGVDESTQSRLSSPTIKIELINFVEQGVPKNDDLPFFS